MDDARNPPLEWAFVHVTIARRVRQYVVWVAFNDGTPGELDLADELDGQVFEPLKDIEHFKRFGDPLLERISTLLREFVQVGFAQQSPTSLHAHAMSHPLSRLIRTYSRGDRMDHLGHELGS